MRLEILPARIRHCDQRSLLYLGVIDAQNRRDLFLELEVDRHPLLPRAERRSALNGSPLALRCRWLEGGARLCDRMTSAAMR
jgi:hypothetical protein